MTQCIIYKKDEGGIAVIYPTPEALSLYGIQAVALKDVPSGKPFKIIDIQDLPDRNTRNYWDVDVNLLTDGIGSESSNFPENGGL